MMGSSKYHFRNKNFCYEQIINHFTLTGKNIFKTGSIYSVTKTTSKQNIMGGIPARRKDTIFWRQELCRSNLSIGSWLSNVSLRSLRTIVFHDHLFMFAEAIKWWKPNLIAPSKEFQYNLSCLQTLAIFWLDMQWGGELKQDKSALLVVLIAITQQSARSSCQFFFIFLFVFVLLKSVIQCWSYHSYIFARLAEDLALN